MGLEPTILFSERIFNSSVDEQDSKPGSRLRSLQISRVVVGNFHHRSSPKFLEKIFVERQRRRRCRRPTSEESASRFDRDVGVTDVDCAAQNDLVVIVKVVLKSWICAFHVTLILEQGHNHTAPCFVLFVPLDSKHFYKVLLICEPTQINLRDVSS